MALLAADDPSYAALLERADCTLAELQDQWFRFLESDNQHRRVDEWRTWWQDAGVPLPDQRSDVSRTYLMTWNPGREKDSPDHPPPEALQDIATHGSAILPWRISNLHNVFVGERVFLHRQGHEPKGLVGAGRIAGPVEVIATSKSKAPGHQVPVRWTQLFTEPIVLLKSLEDTGDKISEWKAQKRGNVLSAINAPVAEAFWKLAEVARSSPDASTAFHKNVVQIRFNAWHYIETNLWASLVDQILTGLDSWLRKEASGQGGKVIEDVFGRLEAPRRLLLESVSELVGAREQEQTAKQDLETANQNLVAARKDLEAAGGLSASDALRAVLDSDEGARKKIAEAAESLGIPDLVASGRQLSELVEQAREDGNRLSLISDSIARRLGQPLWLLAAILLLYFPLFVVIVAVDSRWVSNALIDRYPGLLGYQGEGQGHASPTEDGSRDDASPRDYLEKIFQVPYWVRPVEETASRHMVKSLVGGWPQDDATPPPLPAAPGGSGAAGDDKPADPVGGGDDEEKTVEVGWIDPNPRSLELTVPEKKFLSQMAPYVNPSPRTLRRFVNVYRVLRSGLKENDLHQVTRESGDPALHRALIAQLAMVSGAPHLCEQYFVALRNLAQEADPVTQLATDFKNEWGSRGPSEEVEAIAGALRALVQSGNDSWAMIELLRDHADTVKRYSFGGEPLINARSGSVPPEPRSP